MQRPSRLEQFDLFDEGHQCTENNGNAIPIARGRCVNVVVELTTTVRPSLIAARHASSNPDASPSTRFAPQCFRA